MTTQTEVLPLALEALEKIATVNAMDYEYQRWAKESLAAIKEALAQPEQEPVAMKFKIYKPTVPDPMRQDINDALLPWVYDQSRGSGFVASMWVTPVATLPPQRKPMTDEQIEKLLDKVIADKKTKDQIGDFARAIEAAHGIKE